MRTGELWINNSTDNNAVLIGKKIKDNEWECVYLIKTGNNKYSRKTGRVSSIVDPSACYTGDGTVFESEFSKFYSCVPVESYVIEQFE